MTNPADEPGGIDLPLSELDHDTPPGPGPMIRLIKRALREGRVTAEHAEQAIAMVRAQHGRASQPVK